MLQVMRNYGNSWPVKILLGLIVVSFGVFWGIGADFSFQMSTPAIVKMKGSQITFRDLGGQIQRVLRSMGPAGINPSLDLLMKIESQLLKEMITRMLFMQDAQVLGLSAPEEMIRKAIENDPEFGDELGHFSRDRFYRRLAETQTAEEVFVDTVREALLLQQLSTAIAAPIPFPPVFFEAAARFWDKPMRIQLAILPYGEATVADPTPEELEAYYKEHQSTYFRPEKRTFRLISFVPQTAAPDELDADRAARDQLREVEDALAEGMPLPEVIQKFNLTVETFSDLTQEEAAAKGVPDVVIEQAFTQAEGEDGPFERDATGRYRMIVVDSITPETAPPLEEVKAQVQKELRAMAQQASTQTTARQLVSTVKEGKVKEEKSSNLAAALRDLKKKAPTSWLRSRMSITQDVDLPQSLRQGIEGMHTGDIAFFDAPQEKLTFVVQLQEEPSAPIPEVPSLTPQEWTDRIAFYELPVLYENALRLAFNLKIDQEMLNLLNTKLRQAE